ncbi:MAG TPA: WYL domain-containing protein [Actinomycetota bacterium]|nr:WYL domain-containing protein [Actinomycetota bacterium]
MAADDTMEPLERLLNLVGLLLETPVPLTFEQIRETLEAYRSDNLDSAKRKFERDKDILREYGVPLEMAGTDAWDVEQGYRIRKDRYYLPEISFTPEEVTALFVAAQSASEETAATRGVRKLLYGADGGLLVGAGSGPLIAGPDARGDRVLAAADAASAHRRIGFGYRTSQGTVSERLVDAYGVVYRGGHWYLVGLDGEREAMRAFRLSRFTTEVADLGEGSAPPEGFRAIDHVEAGPWQPGGEDRAAIAFAPAAAVLAEGAFPGARRTGERPDGRVVLEIPAADEHALAGLVLQYGPDAEVVEPASLRDEVIRRLEAVAGG